MNAFDTFTLSPGGGGSVLRGTAPRAWAMLLGLAVSLGIVRCCFYLEPVRPPGPTVFRFLKWRTNHLRPPCGAHPPAGAASPSAARGSASEGSSGGDFPSRPFPCGRGSETVLVSWGGEVLDRVVCTFISLIILNFQVNFGSGVLNLPSGRGTPLPQEQCFSEEAPVRGAAFHDQEVSLACALGKRSYDLKIYRHGKTRPSGHVARTQC